jgi:uncharacterized coiled-coil protein SlyX
MNPYTTTFNAIGETLDRMAHRADRDRRLAREEAADARDEQVIAGLNRKIDTLRMMLAERANELDEARDTIRRLKAAIDKGTSDAA